MCSVNSYDQEATVVEFGKLGVSLFFLFFSLLHVLPCGPGSHILCSKLCTED